VLPMLPVLVDRLARHHRPEVLAEVGQGHRLHRRVGGGGRILVLDWPFAAAISVILLGLTAFVMYAYNRLVERGWFAGVFQ
jgi:hypothetical protein